MVTLKQHVLLPPPIVTTTTATTTFLPAHLLHYITGHYSGAPIGTMALVFLLIKSLAGAMRAREGNG